ncbi:MAG: molybdopterin-dependent oxidoreductase [Anaerolineaceae bacterium]|nr:molybdopterin-dependent oxidoreductase [Anaerolineaceae bacterium]
MKKIILLFLIILSVSSCAPKSAGETDSTTLIVGNGEEQKIYTLEMLKALPQTEAVFNEITYIGVSIQVLFSDSGFAANDYKAVKVIASDGYSMNYDPELFMREDVIVAHAMLDAPLTEEEGNFRMVLPGEEGKLNIRQVIEIKAVP